MNEENVGRKRASSLPPRGNPRVTLPDGNSPVTHESEDVLPPQFSAIARGGLVPGGGQDSMSSADPQRYSGAVCVQRMQHTPFQNHLDDAMTNPARGIMGVTSERHNDPLPSEAHPTAPDSMNATQLTDAGKVVAERRMACSMLVSMQPPSSEPQAVGVS